MHCTSQSQVRAKLSEDSPVLCVSLVYLYYLWLDATQPARAHTSRVFGANIRKSIMSLLELGPIIFGPKRDLINFLQNKHLIARNMDCQQCGIAMNLQRRDETVCSDCYSWRCPTCYTFRSVRHKSFFSKSRLSLQKWLLLMHLWSRDCPVTDAAQEVEITEKSAIQIYQYFVLLVFGQP